MTTLIESETLQKIRHSISDYNMLRHMVPHFTDSFDYELGCWFGNIPSLIVCNRQFNYNGFAHFQVRLDGLKLDSAFLADGLNEVIIPYYLPDFFDRCNRLIYLTYWHSTLYRNGELKWELNS